MLKTARQRRYARTASKRKRKQLEKEVQNSEEEGGDAAVDGAVSDPHQFGPNVGVVHSSFDAPIDEPINFNTLMDDIDSDENVESIQNLRKDTDNEEYESAEIDPVRNENFALVLEKYPDIPIVSEEDQQWKNVVHQPEISNFLLDMEYKLKDKNCFGCAYLKIGPSLGPVQRELVQRLQEQIRTCVFSGMILDGVQSIHDELEEVRAKLNPRIPATFRKYPEWPVWQIIRHLYMHGQDPILRTFLDLQDAQEHLIKVKFSKMYRERINCFGRREEKVDPEGLKAYNQLQMMVLRLRMASVKKMNFFNPDTEQAAPNPFAIAPSVVTYNFISGKVKK
jgi:hypothetical protein